MNCWVNYTWVPREIIVGQIIVWTPCRTPRWQRFTIDNERYGGAQLCDLQEEARSVQLDLNRGALKRMSDVKTNGKIYEGL